MRKRVHDKALVEVRGCLRDWGDGRDAAREAKAVAETIIAPEYEGRVLIELLQNAHDAHSARATDECRPVSATVPTRPRRTARTDLIGPYSTLSVIELMERLGWSRREAL